MRFGAPILNLEVVCYLVHVFHDPFDIIQVTSMPTEHWTSNNPSNFEVPTLLNVLLDEMRSDAGMMSGFCGFNSLARAIAWHTVGGGGGGGRLEETHPPQVN